MIRRRVAILVFPDVEVLDFCGPFEVFSTTRLDEERRREEPSPYEVVLVAEGTGPVVASGGLKVVPDYGLDDCPALDVLLVPGGWGTRREMGNARLLEWIAERGPTGRTARVGLHRGAAPGPRGAARREAGDDALEVARPAAARPSRRSRSRDDLHVVEDGDVITSAGISAGIDLALRVVARHHGEAVARATARHMEYPFPEDNRRRI